MNRSDPGSGAMFDRIAHRYDLLNRILSLGADRRWRQRAVRALALHGKPRVLDVAAGTADLTVAIAGGCEGARVVGLDPSTRMIVLGKKKCLDAGLADRVTLLVGDALDLPFPDHSFDGVTIAFGIRNVLDRARALREMARVTRPLGRVVVLELAQPREGWLSWLARFHVHRVVPLIGGFLSRAQEYRYLAHSIERFPPPDAFRAMMEDAGLDVLAVERLAWGACALFVARRGRGSRGDPEAEA